MNYDRSRQRRSKNGIENEYFRVQKSFSKNMKNVYGGYLIICLLLTYDSYIVTMFSFFSCYLEMDVWRNRDVNILSVQLNSLHNIYCNWSFSINKRIKTIVWFWKENWCRVKKNNWINRWIERVNKIWLCLCILFMNVVLLCF